MSPFWRARSNDFIVAVIFSIILFTFNFLMTANFLSSLIMGAIGFAALMIVAPLFAMVFVFIVSLFRPQD